MVKLWNVYIDNILMLDNYSGYQTDLNFAKNICTQIASALPTLQLPRSNPFVFTHGM